MKQMKFYFLWLSLIIIIVFILQLIIPQFTSWFILNERVFSGEVWRYLTSIFLHGSITHLAFNLFALLFFGIVLEKTIGSNKFLLVFFASGIIGNLISVYFYNSSLGASGAIYGIIGCVTVLRPMMMVWAFGLIMPMFVAAGLYVAADVLRVFGFNPGNVGSIAHLSGMGVGALIGLIIGLGKRKRREHRSNNIEIPEYYIESWERKNLK